jgi:hypothetical protein
MAGSSWAWAAEIGGIPKLNGAVPVSRFEKMLRDVYLPEVRNGSAGNSNNIDPAMFEVSALLYESVMDRAKQHIRSYTYLS